MTSIAKRFWDNAQLPQRVELLATYYKTEESIAKYMLKDWNDLPTNFKAVQKRKFESRQQYPQFKLIPPKARGQCPVCGRMSDMRDAYVDGTHNECYEKVNHI